MIKLDSIMNATAEICSSICGKDDLEIVDCSTCFVFCPEKCQAKYYANYELPSPPTHPHHKATPSTFLTVSMVLLAASFVLVLAYTLYLRRRRRYNIPSTTTTNLNLNDPQQQQEGDFLDHGGGATVEHHIWYIRTVGLDPAAVSSITALKYRKDEGLVEGTDCSVCLSEFQEDEALRLLPKCSHAFHVACIDTWLRSHTNCPMCRSPVLAGPVKLSSSADQSSGSSHESEETRIEILSGDVEESEVAENPNESLRVEPSRRSVSLDCLGSKELEVIKELRNLNSGKRIEKKLERLRSGGSSNNGQNVSSSSSASAMKRSKSCQGKFIMCRPIRVTDSILPLRSV